MLKRVDEERSHVKCLRRTVPALNLFVKENDID